LRNTGVFKVGLFSCAVRWIVENGIGEDGRKPSRPKAQWSDSFPWSGVWTMACWEVRQRYKAQGVICSSPRCFVSFETVKQKVTGQMGRACGPPLGLSKSWVLVKESDFL